MRKTRIFHSRFFSFLVISYKWLFQGIIDGFVYNLYSEKHGKIAQIERSIQNNSARDD